MKTITYLSQEEIREIPSCIRYFFEGDNGFFYKKGLPKYSYDFNLERTLIANRVLAETTAEDFSELCKYIGSQREHRLKEIEELENKIRSHRKSLEELWTVGNTIEANKNFKYNIDKILNTFKQ